jgi:hypothetical protein
LKAIVTIHCFYFWAYKWMFLLLSLQMMMIATLKRWSSSKKHLIQFLLLFKRQQKFLRFRMQWGIFSRRWYVEIQLPNNSSLKENNNSVSYQQMISIHILE